MLSLDVGHFFYLKLEPCKFRWYKIMKSQHTSLAKIPLKAPLVHRLQETKKLYLSFLFTITSAVSLDMSIVGWHTHLLGSKSADTKVKVGYPGMDESNQQVRYQFFSPPKKFIRFGFFMGDHFSASWIWKLALRDLVQRSIKIEKLIRNLEDGRKIIIASSVVPGRSLHWLHSKRCTGHAPQLTLQKTASIVPVMFRISFNLYYLHNKATSKEWKTYLLAKKGSRDWVVANILIFRFLFKGFSTKKTGYVLINVLMK